MRKILLVLAVCLQLVQAYAQESTKKVSTGIKIGAVNSRIGELPNDSKQGFYLGVQMPIAYSKLYTLQPEVVYNQKGAKNIVIPNNDDFYSVGDQKVDLTLGYVDFNMISKFSYKRFNAQLGPGFAVLVNSSDKKVEKVDITFNVGAGVDITKNIGVEFRWISSGVDLNMANYENGSTYNMSFQIGGYYNF